VPGKRNPIAKEVRTPKYKTRTVKPKKGKGSFKRLKNVITEDEWVNNFVKAYREVL
jgi:alternative ribosome-rescue factor